jgi:hypothetical protein
MIPPLQATYRENQQPFVTLECADDSNAPCPLCSPAIPDGLADHRRKSYFYQRGKSTRSVRMVRHEIRAMPSDGSWFIYLFSN